MKKGASHVDWAISMGIFLIYVLLMFVFLKPATEPAYSETSMLDMVYSGLKNDTTATIQKKYLIITPQGSEFDESNPEDKNTYYYMRIRNPVGIDVEEWKTLDNANHLTLVNESLKDVRGQNLTAVPFDFEDDRNPGRLDKILEIKAPLKNGDNIFWFLSSEDITYLPHHVNVFVISDAKKLEDQECVHRTTPPGNRDYPYCILDDISNTPTTTDDDPLLNFTYQFGVAETFTAFSEEKLNKLKQEYDNQYLPLKANWSFPIDKNFNITIERLS